jgi:sulfoxide reductase catalytic subunit YedY
VRVIRKNGWEIPQHRITPEALFISRRSLMFGGGALAAAGLVGLGSVLTRYEAGAFARTPVSDPSRSFYPAARNETYSVTGSITPEEINERNARYYEFGTSRRIAQGAEALNIRPWTVRFDGLVERPFTIDIDDLIRRIGLEERVYRHRFAEPMSMVVPWTGFPLAALVEMAKPLSSATFVRMESFYDPEVATGQKQFWYPWPYIEGLTVAEATNELAFMVTGAYGKPLANASGAPLRLHLPWKYGFKSIKGVQRISFTDKQPLGFWQAVAGQRYGFWANVNPDVPHPEWSQARERDIATGAMMPTRLFNGYGDLVAHLYSGLEGQALYM